MGKIRVLLPFMLMVSFMQIRCSSIETERYVHHTASIGSSEKMNNLLFKVYCGREKYHLGEDIYVTFSIENRDTISLVVKKRLALNAEDTPESAREVFLNLTSPNGINLAFLGFIEVGYTTKESFALLEPGDIIYSADRYLLNRYYDISLTGEYRIDGTYENYSGPEFGYRNVWTGKAKSEPVEFEVVEEEEEKQQDR